MPPFPWISSRVRWTGFALLLALVVAGVSWWHSAILQWLAMPLICSDSTTHCQYLWIRTEIDFDPTSDLGCNAAAEFYRARPGRRILLVERRHDRLVELGVLPPLATLLGRELAARGVPREAITVVGDAPCGLRWELPVIANWLRARPEAIVELPCDSFCSAGCRARIDAQLDPSDAARLRVRALPHPGHNATNWWQTRLGVAQFMFAWLRRTYAALGGVDGTPTRTWEPDDYETWLHTRIAQGTP